MNRYFPNVFRPIKIGHLEIKNRVEMSPVIPSLATGDGFVTRELIEYNRSLARGGAGIITIGDTAIDFEYGQDHLFQLNLGSDKVIAGLNVLVETIHRYGAKASIELTHPGRLRAPVFSRGQPPLAPSAQPTAEKGFIADITGRFWSDKVIRMTQGHINMVIAQYADACFRCWQAGFEMVMIHGAHGQLPAQFVSPYTNKRTDRYGGSPQNRARFVLELLDAIRQKVGDKLAIEYRISGEELIDGGMQVEDTIAFVRLIQDKIDLLHVSMGLLVGVNSINRTIQPTYIPHGVNVPFAAKIKEAVNIPVVAVGSIDMEMADRIIGEGKCDMVAMARANIADTDYVTKNQYGRLDDVRPCVRCNNCCTAPQGLPIRCAVNPTVGREVEYAYIRPADIKKKVVVVGGGPAGMEVAITAASRGHRVTLFEKNETLGGALIYAAALPFKADMKKYLDWLVRRTKNTPGVDIRLATEGNPETIEAQKPDVLIIAVGAEPIIPGDIPGIESNNVVWGGYVDTGEKQTGQNVVVAGAGLIGCETGLYLAQQGKRVTVIDVLSLQEIAAEAFNKIGLMQLMHDCGVQFKTEVSLKLISKNGVTVTDKKDNRYAIPADTVVIALGCKSRKQTIEALAELAPVVHVIGDCANPRNLRYAIHDGFNIAVEL
jgi:2,4-dienoyl-CoA reductase-like NADH-dependent reductase (Old Yellow Enzyme family)/thioredoxin reductase